MYIYIYIFNSALLAKEHQETKEILQNVSNNRLSLKINDLFALYVIFLKDIVFGFFCQIQHLVTNAEGNTAVSQAVLESCKFPEDQIFSNRR